jgi:hypothetical protein
MGEKLKKELALLKRETEVFEKQLTIQKKSIIKDLKAIDKNKMFEVKPEKKISFWDKVLIVFGYGKKR